MYTKLLVLGVLGVFGLSGIAYADRPVNLNEILEQVRNPRGISVETIKEKVPLKEKQVQKFDTRDFFLNSPLSKETKDLEEIPYKGQRSVTPKKSAEFLAEFRRGPLFLPDETRGDPKTDYDQKENCQHGNGCEEEQTIEIDLLGYIIGAQGSSHEAFNVTYLSPTLWTADQVIVTYDLIEGAIIGAVRYYDGQTLYYEASTILVSPYCTELYGCIQ